MKVLIVLVCLSFAAAKPHNRPFQYRPGRPGANSLKPSRPGGSASNAGMSQHTKPLRPGTSGVVTNNEECKNSAQFIVGGSEAKEHAWPWMVSLQDRSGFHFCGGSLVRKNDGHYAVITAAHCVFGQATFAVFGEHNFDEPSSATQRIRVSNKEIHTNYNGPQGISYDIAVLTLVKDPTINDAVQPISITSLPDSTGCTATVIGWGTLSSGGQTPSTLQQVEKPIIYNNDCADAYSGYGYDVNTMMCAGLIGVGGKDSCQGDSGGPLMVKRGGVYELAGVVSWGIGCADGRYPGVYADVFKLSNWLNKMGIY